MEELSYEQYLVEEKERTHIRYLLLERESFLKSMISSLKAQLKPYEAEHILILGLLSKFSKTTDLPR